MLTWLSCGAAATAPAAEGSAAAAPSALLAPGGASACSSLTADDHVFTRCAAGCQSGFCLAPGGWKCTCTSSSSVLADDARTEQRLLLGQGRRERSGAQPLTPSCAALAEIDPERTINQTALVAGGWDLARRHPTLVVSFLGCALETARTPAASEVPSSRAERQLEKDEELVSCPLSTPNASGAAREILRLHRTMLEAGFVRLDGSRANEGASAPSPAPSRGGPRIADPRAQLKSAFVRGAGNHETRMWPRPAVCASHPGRRLDLKEYIDRPQLSKLVNARRGLEYRPVLKAGSTMMRHLLPCLQPGQWEEVPQSAPVRNGSTLLVLQRDPIIRFASALVEVMERALRGMCPEGPCNKERDGFEAQVTPAAVKSATLWFDVAELLLGSRGGDSSRRGAEGGVDSSRGAELLLGSRGGDGSRRGATTATATATATTAAAIAATAATASTATNATATAPTTAAAAGGGEGEGEARAEGAAKEGGEAADMQQIAAASTREPQGGVGSHPGPDRSPDREIELGDLREIAQSPEREIVPSPDREIEHRRRLKLLVNTATLDAACNLKYYASVHFASQTGLLMQGPTPPATPARFYDLENLGNDLDTLLGSELVRSLLGEDAPPSRDALESCLGQERTARVNVALRALSSPRSRVSLRAESPASGDPRELPQNHHDDRSLPSSAEVLEAIEADPPAKLLIESMFKMDSACTAPRAATGTRHEG